MPGPVSECLRNRLADLFWLACFGWPAAWRSLKTRSAAPPCPASFLAIPPAGADQGVEDRRQCGNTLGPLASDVRICAVDYALANGLIVTSGYINGSASRATVTLVVDGGTGAYQNAHGYGELQPTSTGSDMTLHLTS